MKLLTFVGLVFLASSLSFAAAPPKLADLVDPAGVRHIVVRSETKSGVMSSDGTGPLTGGIIQAFARSGGVSVGIQGGGNTGPNANGSSGDLAGGSRGAMPWNYPSGSIPQNSNPVTIAPTALARPPSPPLERSYPELVVVPLLHRLVLPVTEAIVEVGVIIRTPLTRLFEEYPTIEIPDGQAIQDTSPPALAARSHVEQGGVLYRTGTRGRSNTGEDAQFWATEHPNNPGYASRYGIPPENLERMDFIERARLRTGSDFVTRVAPASPDGSNPGGGIEVVVPRADQAIQMEAHSSL